MVCTKNIPTDIMLHQPHIRDCAFFFLTLTCIYIYICTYTCLVWTKQVPCASRKDCVIYVMSGNQYIYIYIGYVDILPCVD